MDQHINCACGWTGPGAMLRAGMCPQCMRPANVPYGYPPLPSWNKPLRQHQPMPAAAAGTRWCATSSCRPRWLSLVLMFALVASGTFAMTSILRSDRHCSRPPQHVKKKDLPQREQRVWDVPMREQTPKYSPAPKVQPVPRGTKKEGEKYEDADCEIAPQDKK